MSSSDRVDAEGLGEQPAQPEGLVGRLPLGHVQAEDALLAERGDAQRGDHAGVDAAGERDDDAAPLGLGEVVGQDAPMIRATSSSASIAQAVARRRIGW